MPKSNQQTFFVKAEHALRRRNLQKALAASRQTMPIRVVRSC
jgi:hypothetical protein